jgi:hypothetical protein
MIPLHVIMLNVLVDNVSEMPPPEEDHSIKALGFDRPDISLGVSIQIRTLGWELHATHARRGERTRKLCRVQRVTIVDEVTFSIEESGTTVCQVSRDLDHPGSIGIWSNACYLDPTSREFHHEEHCISNESERRPHLHGEEIARSKGIPVISNELVPCRLL